MFEKCVVILKERMIVSVIRNVPLHKTRCCFEKECSIAQDANHYATLRTYACALQVQSGTIARARSRCGSTADYMVLLSSSATAGSALVCGGDLLAKIDVSFMSLRLCPTIPM